MQVNPLVVPTLIGSAACFWLGLDWIKNSEIPPDQMKLAVSSGCLRVEGFDLAVLNVKNAPSSAPHQH